MASPIVAQFLRHARERPQAAAFVFVRRHNDAGDTVSWGALLAQAEAIAARLPASRGERPAGVLLCCRDNRRFVTSLIAVWLRGQTVIPAAGGFSARLGERNRHIVAATAPDAIVHDLPADMAAALADIAPDAHVIDLGDPASGGDGPMLAAGDAADLLQFTSGSTSSPKPVLLRATQVAVSCGAIARTYSLSQTSVGVHWLPLHHDMGLVGSVLVPLRTGCLSVIMDSVAFMQRPASWLEQISRWRGTITSAPNFACDRLLAGIVSDDLSSIDLSSLETVVLGGEPVSAMTVSRLIARLASLGLRASSIAPSYGMAEVTLLVSSGRKPGGAQFSRRHSLQDCACLGPVIDELDVIVQDFATGRPVAEGMPGEIILSGHCAGHVLPPGSDWRAPPPVTPIHSGDYGYFEGGELFITGRSARKLIIRGRNFFAEDIERLVFEAVTPGTIEAVAAIGVDSEGSQQLCLLIEVPRRGVPLALPALNAILLQALGIKPARIVQLRAGTLPRTSSGKIRHGVAWDWLTAGKFEDRTMAQVEPAQVEPPQVEPAGA